MAPEKICRPSEVTVSDVSFAASILSCNPAVAPDHGELFAAVAAAGSAEIAAGTAGGAGSGGSASAAAVISAMRAEIHRQPNQPPARTASITSAGASAIQGLLFVAEIRVTGTEGDAGA